MTEPTSFLTNTWAGPLYISCLVSIKYHPKSHLPIAELEVRIH